VKIELIIGAGDGRGEFLVSGESAGDLIEDKVVGKLEERGKIRRETGKSKTGFDEPQGL
jgi:hypothetical protein